MCLPALAAIPGIVVSAASTVASAVGSVGSAVGGAVAAGGAAFAAASLPTQIGIVGLATSVVSTGISIHGQVQEGKAAEANARYEAQISEYEAELARQQGKVESLKHGINARREYGRNILAASSSGLDLSFGSTSRLLTETRKFQAIDQDIINRTASSRVLGLTIRADNQRNNADNIGLATRLSAGASAVGGIAKTAISAASLYDSGAFADLGASTKRAVKYIDATNFGPVADFGGLT